MAPRLNQWGAAGWRFLHSVSFSYPAKPSFEERRHMFTFLRSVGHVLPCKRCRAHYNAYVEARLIVPSSAPLASREALSRFLVDLHNDVNARLQRPSVHYDTVRYEYEVDCGDGWTRLLLLWLVVGALVAACAWYAKRRWYARRHLP